MTFFLKIPVFRSADLSVMASLCGVCVCVNNFSKTTRPRDMLLFLKDTSLSRMVNRKIHAVLSRLFPRAITREVPLPKA